MNHVRRWIHCHLHLNPLQQNLPKAHTEHVKWSTSKINLIFGNWIRHKLFGAQMSMLNPECCDFHLLVVKFLSRKQKTS